MRNILLFLGVLLTSGIVTQEQEHKGNHAQTSWLKASMFSMPGSTLLRS